MVLKLRKRRKANRLRMRGSGLSALEAVEATKSMKFAIVLMCAHKKTKDSNINKNKLKLAALKCLQNYLKIAL
jgi:hypothetical protein